MASRIRADQLLVDQGLAESRTRAQAMIMAGKVLSGTTRIDKPGQRVDSTVRLTVKGPDHPWVSRGALKLIRGLEAFGIDPADTVAADIGASTGGFSEVLLDRGAARVYAVDVGHGQLAWSLRQEPRITVLERTNARYLTPVQIPETLDIVVCDASFIGLRTVLPAAMELCGDGARLVALIKPQFEVGRQRVGKGGIVRDRALHEEVCTTIREWLDSLPGWTVLGLVESPITGPDGNIEFLIGAEKCVEEPQKT